MGTKWGNSAHLIDKVCEMEGARFYYALLKSVEMLMELASKKGGQKLTCRMEIAIVSLVLMCKLQVAEEKQPDMVAAATKEIRGILQSERVSQIMLPVERKLLQTISDDLVELRDIKALYSYADKCCCDFIVNNLHWNKIHYIMLVLSFLKGIKDHDDDFVRTRTAHNFREFENSKELYVDYLLEHCMTDSEDIAENLGKIQAPEGIMFH